MALLPALRYVLIIIFVAAATALTQLGGIIFLAALCLAWMLRRWSRLLAMSAGFAFFILAVPFVNLVIVPSLAALNERAPLPCEATAQRPSAALSPIYCVLGRNYVRAEVKTMLEAMARDLGQQYPGLTVAYLDASYPFFDGFSLPPHLSHHDGRRIDLAYFYKDAAGNSVPLTAPSPIGYWGFEIPPANEPSPCADKVRWLTFRWDMGWFQAVVRHDLVLDEERTAAMLRWLTETGPNHGVTKILIEPYIAKRLQVASPIIRFQGCRAARHDDHVHIEVSASR